MLPSVQSATQFMQRWHSALRQRLEAIGSSAPWQCSRQRLQSSQWPSFFSRPSTAQREITPSSAPSGHSARHQKRVMRKFSAKMTMKMSPRKKACRKYGCLKLSTRCPRMKCSTSAVKRTAPTGLRYNGASPAFTA